MKLIRFNWLILAVLLIQSKGFASEGVDPKAQLPLIRNIAPIPVQWERGLTAADFEGAGQILNSHFAEALRRTKRFTILNETLVRNTWRSASTRAQLVEEYEVSAFAALNIAPRGDTVTITARILSPSFDVWLQETDVISRESLEGMRGSTAEKRLDELVFKLANRLPYDIYVTSVQGNFVTLSGGSDQNISTGMTLKILAGKVASLHPATKTWHTFETSEVGTAKVIEVKGRTSIAKIESQISQGAVLTGQGIKLEGIDSRKAFARSDDKDIYAAAKEPGSGLASAVTPDGKRVEDPNRAKPEPVILPKASDAEKESELEKKVEEKPEEKPAEKPASEEAPAAASEDQSKSEPKEKLPTTLEAGPRLWSISGDGKASAKFPMYLVNSVSGSTPLRYELVKSTQLMAGGMFGYGPTSGGSFMALGAHGDLLWSGALGSDGDTIRGWYAGPTVAFELLNVKSESFGSLTALRAGAVGGVTGHLSERDAPLRMDPFAEARLYLLSFGSAGADGKSGSISGTGWLFKAGAFFGETVKKAGDRQWGASLELTNDSFSGGAKVSRSSFGLLGMYRLVL